MSRKKKMEQNATVDFRVQKSNKVVKMNHPLVMLADNLRFWQSVLTHKNRENELWNMVREVLGSASSKVLSILNPPGVKVMANASQNPP